MPNKKNKYRLLIAIPLFAIAMLSGCGGGDGDSGGEVSFSDLWDNEFSGCGSNCHNPFASDGTNNGPDLSTKALFYSELVNKNVTNNFPGWNRDGDCDDTLFIEPGNADKSTLMTGLSQTYADNIVASGDCIASSYNMHDVNKVWLNSPNAVADWINQGAKNN